MRCAVVVVTLVPAIALADASVAGVAPGGPPTIAYTRGSDGDYDFTFHGVGAVLYAAVDGAALRPERGARRVLARLPLGARVRVVGFDRSGYVDRPRVDRWYRVRSDAGEGWIAGGELTPLSFSVGDPVTVAFGGDFQIHVRWRGQELKLEPAGQGYLSRKGGNASARLVDAGVPLLEIDSRPEACADFSTTYVSFVGGVLRVALSLAGLMDPPSSSDYRVRFDARARTATVTRETVEDEGAPPRRESREYRLVSGVFR